MGIFKKTTNKKRNKRMKSSKNLTTRNDYNITGSAGEYYVAAEIAKRGAVATLTLKNTPRIDVLASNPLKGTFANIQVKTRSQRNTQGWLLSGNIEQHSDIQNHFIIFVHLKSLNQLPEYYVIPYNEFAAFSRKKYKRWLSQKGRNGQKHNDNNVRNFKPDRVNSSFYRQDALLGMKYKDKWELLGIF